MSENLPIPEIAQISTKDSIADAKAAIDAEKRGRAIAFQEELNKLIKQYNVQLLPCIEFEGNDHKASWKIVPLDLQ